MARVTPTARNRFVKSFCKHWAVILTSVIFILQGELEHRTAKARYARTDKRDFIKQMTQIERRQERIRHIHARNFSKGNINPPGERIAQNPDVHHCIGKWEHHSEQIGLFVKKNLGDPAVQVWTLLSLPELFLMSQLELHSNIEEAHFASDSIFTEYWRCQ
jgi:hypothetical protein